MPNSEGARMMKNFIRQLLTTAHTEWREQAKREVTKLNNEPNTYTHEQAIAYVECLADVANLPFLQPPKDTV